MALSSFLAALVLSSEFSLREQVSAAIRTSNQLVYEKFKGNGGTTISALIITDANEAVLLNVGDSRIYEFVPGKQLKQLTIDDTIEAALPAINYRVKNLNDLTNLSKSQNQLLQYIGIGQDLEPHITTIKGDLPNRGYILATDGAYKISDNVFQQIVLHASSPKEMVKRVNYVSEWAGGFDNSSVICLWPSASSSSQLFKDNVTSYLKLYGIHDTLEIQGQLTQKSNYEERPLYHSAGQEPSIGILPLLREERPSSKPPKITKNPTSKKRKGSSKKRQRNEGFLPLEITLGDKND